ncbi:hypothetical protein COOONC_06461 [Cooperia oncophora]
MELLIFVLVVISVSQACSPVPQPIYVGRGPDTADVILVTDAVFDPAKINEYMGYWPKTLIEKYGNLLGDLTKHSWTNHNGKFAYTFTIENSDCYKVDSWMKQIVASSPHYVTYVLNCNKPTTTPATTQATNLYINLNGGSGGNGNGNGLDMSGRQRSPQIVVVREPQPNPNVVIVGNPANQQQLGSRQQSPVVVLGNQQQPQQQSPIVVLRNQQQPQQQSPVVVLRNQQQPQQQSPVVVVRSPQQQQNPPVVVVENRRPPPPKVVYDVDTDVPDDCDD